MLAVVHVCHLSAAESQGDLHSVSLGQELPSCTDLGVQIVGIDIGGKSDLLDIDDLLLLLLASFSFLTCSYLYLP